MYAESVRADQARDLARTLANSDSDANGGSTTTPSAAAAAAAAGGSGLRKRATAKGPVRDKTPPPPSNEQVKQNVAALPTEPDAAADAGTVCKVVIRMPGGARCERRFNRTDRIQALYDVIEAHGFAKKRHVLCTAYPRRPLDTATDTLEQAGLTNNVVLHCDPRIFY
jgi:hypothetical protein